MDESSRHLALLTRTIEVVNSSLDLQEVMEAIAHEVASAMQTDACFVYLYDEVTGELVLRATHGTAVEGETERPRMRPGEGITGVAAAERAPVMIPSRAHLDPRFKQFPNLREDQYESILAVPILASRPREKLEGALNVRTREPRVFSDEEIGLLVAIASQVAQSIEHARLYEAAQRRVRELEALARVSEAVSESLYLEESLEANPHSYETLNLYARAAFANGDIERSVDLFRRAADVRKEDFQAMILLAQSLRVLGRTEEAEVADLEGIRRAERTLDLNPHDSRALSLGANALGQVGQAERALRWSRRAIELYPDEQSVLINGACLRAKLGMNEEALAILEEVFERGWGKRDWIEHDPDYDSLRDDPRFQALLDKLH